MMTEKEKLEKKAVKLVEKYLAMGEGITNARHLAMTRIGISYGTIVRLTKHLSPVKSETE